jgi:hypothetical protein
MKAIYSYLNRLIKLKNKMIIANCESKVLRVEDLHFMNYDLNAQRKFE